MKALLLLILSIQLFATNYENVVDDFEVYPHYPTKTKKYKVPVYCIGGIKTVVKDDLTIQHLKIVLPDGKEVLAPCFLKDGL